MPLRCITTSIYRRVQCSSTQHSERPHSVWFSPVKHQDVSHSSHRWSSCWHQPEIPPNAVFSYQLYRLSRFGTALKAEWESHHSATRSPMTSKGENAGDWHWSTRLRRLTTVVNMCCRQNGWRSLPPISLTIPQTPWDIKETSHRVMIDHDRTNNRIFSDIALLKSTSMEPQDRPIDKNRQTPSSDNFDRGQGEQWPAESKNPWKYSTAGV